MTRLSHDLDQALHQEPWVSDADLVGYYHPRDVVSDPTLTLARKRQLLAFWMSDIHAVVGSPALRSVAGVTTSVDALSDAFSELEEMVDLPAIGARTGSTVAA